MTASFQQLQQTRPVPRLPEMRGWRNMVGSLIDILQLNKNLSRASIYWCICETPRGTVSSNSRFQAVLFQQYFADLSLPAQSASPEEGAGTIPASRAIKAILSRISEARKEGYITGIFRGPLCRDHARAPAKVEIKCNWRLTKDV